jgi:hypothetical protein
LVDGSGLAAATIRNEIGRNEIGRTEILGPDVDRELDSGPDVGLVTEEAHLRHCAVSAPPLKVTH